MKTYSQAEIMAMDAKQLRDACRASGLKGSGIRDARKDQMQQALCHFADGWEAEQVQAFVFGDEKPEDEKPEDEKPENIQAALDLLDLFEKLGGKQQVQQVIKIEIPERPRISLKAGTSAHKLLAECLKRLQVLGASVNGKRQTKNQNLYLAGPTGSGKTYLSGQIAEALGLPFAALALTQGVTESKLFGRCLPDGQFQSTPFLSIYENGGVFLLDECSAGDPNLLVGFNAALENGFIWLADGRKIDRNVDCYIIAADNTWGTESETYTARERLDASFLSRFEFGMIHVDYDTKLEQQLCPDGELLARLWSVRKVVREQRMERFVSTRTISRAFLMSQAYEWEGIRDMLSASWTEQERSKIAAI